MHFSFLFSIEHLPLEIQPREHQSSNPLFQLLTFQFTIFSKITCSNFLLLARCFSNLSKKSKMFYFLFEYKFKPWSGIIRAERAITDWVRKRRGGLLALNARARAAQERHQLRVGRVEGFDNKNMVLNDRKRMMLFLLKKWEEKIK